MSGSQLVVLCANILICLKECCQLPIVGDKIEKVTLNILAARKDKEVSIQGPFFIAVFDGQKEADHELITRIDHLLTLG